MYGRFTGWGDTDTGGTDNTGGYNDPSDAFVPDTMWLLIALTVLLAEG
jgi:hypothetical protein